MTKKYTVCRRVRAFFSPEILQAAAVKRFNAKAAPLYVDDFCILAAAIKGKSTIVHT